VRNDISSLLGAEGIECTFNGLFIVKDEQHVDHHTVVDHAQPNCQSYELYKGILAGKSKGVFNGKIFVREGAQKSNAMQSNRNLLLSDDATINTKPQLEIWADDVRCTHGATVGQLDEDAMFYLRTRGISAEDAKKLLVDAFASEVVATVRQPVLKEHMQSLVQVTLDRLEGARP